MFPATNSEIYVTWRRTLEIGPSFSRHFWLVFIANLADYIGMAQLYSRFHGDPQVRAYLAPFILFMIFVVNYLGYYMLQAYRYVRARLRDPACDEQSAADLLFVSYAGFRSYFVGLSMLYFLMSVASIIPRS